MTAADVLLPMIAIDDGTFYIVDCGNVQVRFPVHQFDEAARYLNRPGRSVSAVARDEKGRPRRAGMVWVECETRAQSALLRRLPVPPSVILRDGARVARTALWWLSEPLKPQLVPDWGRTWVEEANRRLATALGTPKKACDPDHFIRGWEVEHVDPVRYAAREVVGSLPVSSSGGWRRAA